MPVAPLLPTLHSWLRYKPSPNLRACGSCGVATRRPSYLPLVPIPLLVPRLQRVHEQLLSAVLALPLAFFDATPPGRVLNRFSSDTGARHLIPDVLRSACIKVHRSLLGRRHLMPRTATCTGAQHLGAGLRGDAVPTPKGGGAGGGGGGAEGAEGEGGGLQPLLLETRVQEEARGAEGCGLC